MDVGLVAGAAGVVDLVPDPAVEPTMNVDRVAEALNISRASAYEGVKTGEIPSIKIGRRIVVPTAAVRRMLLLDAVGGPRDAA